MFIMLDKWCPRLSCLIMIITISNQQDDKTVAQTIQEYEKSFARYKRFLPLNKEAYDDYLVGNKFDFIIVGSGAAGSVVANRLSEIRQWKILLLETGEHPSFITDIPIIAATFQFTNYNWGYLMEPQQNFCLGLADERMHWPRGKVLGGSSIINYMIYTRGNEIDYDRWAAMGNPGWSYQEVLPYFLKSEDANLEHSDPSYHNKDGQLSVQDVPYRTQSVTTFIKAAKESGYKYVDYNGRNQLGVSYVQANQKNGLRCSAEKAFLRPARFRSNLKVLTKARVTKVLIDPITKKAYGVQYNKNRRYHTATASKEVILSAGSFNSPQLLMLSGVGPKEDLKESQISVIKNLPVGRKLYDHLTFLGLVFTVNQSIVLPNNVLENPKNYLEILLHGSGPFTSLGGVEGLAYFKTNVSLFEEDFPDMEFIFVGGGIHSDKGLVSKKSFKISDKVYNAIWKPLENKHAWSVLPLLLHPKSFGKLKLKSKNPFHWPRLYGNFITDPEGQDLKTFIAGVREVQRISKAPAFQKYGTRQVETPIPGCERHIFDTDDYWECAIRHITVTLHHQVATCKMGPETDPEAVVDNKLKVHGIKNLRVIDTSIIPLPLSAHVNAPAFMIGEKGSDLIKEEWLKN